MDTYGDLATSRVAVTGNIDGRIITSLEIMRSGEVCVWLRDGFLVVGASTPLDGTVWPVDGAV